MRVDLKLYKTFDADLLALSTNGISISALIKTALFHYVRGEIVRFYTPECKTFDFEGKKRSIHIATSIEDGASVDFLRKKLKPRQRAAFLRTLLRECLITQQLGPFLRDDLLIDKETSRMQEVDLSAIPNVIQLSFESRKHDYISKILKSKGKAPPLSESPVPAKMKNRFGDVSDLALKQKNKEVSEENLETTSNSKKSGEEREKKSSQKPIPEDELPLAGVPVEPSFFEDDEEDAPTLDDDLFAQFQNLM